MSLAPLDGIDVQIGRSAEADFEENTWTFLFEGRYHVLAGLYAVLPADDYQRILSRLTKLEHAAWLLGEVHAHGATIDANLQEAVTKYFDPEPLG